MLNFFWIQVIILILFGWLRFDLFGKIFCLKRNALAGYDGNLGTDSWADKRWESIAKTHWRAVSLDEADLCFEVFFLLGGLIQQLFESQDLIIAFILLFSQEIDGFLFFNAFLTYFAEHYIIWIIINHRWAWIYVGGLHINGRLHLGFFSDRSLNWDFAWDLWGFHSFISSDYSRGVFFWKLNFSEKLIGLFNGASMHGFDHLAEAGCFLHWWYCYLFGLFEFDFHVFEFRRG